MYAMSLETCVSNLKQQL